MEKIYVKEILEAVGGQLLGNIDAENTFVVNVQTDSRKAAAGDLFVAIVGERMDGHRFVQGAMEAGAEGCLVSTAPDSIPEGKFCVMVPDTAKAMGDLAAYYRRKLGLPVVAVTGSVGKTTTKDMVASVLSSRFRTLKTAGNLNNHLGLPMTVFRLTAEDEIAVLEMGMNHLGEIDYLVRIAQPDVAVITNVGDAHIGNLGSRENILRAKCEIFRGLRKGGTAVLNRARTEWLIPAPVSLMRCMPGSTPAALLSTGREKAMHVTTGQSISTTPFLTRCAARRRLLPARLLLRSRALAGI